MAEQYKIIHPVKYYRDYTNENIRPDGRSFHKTRPFSVTVNTIETADGSAVVKLGNTTLVCGIKAELAQPKATEPQNGFIIPNIELTPLCSPKYRPGAPSEEAQVYSCSLAAILNNSNCIDLQSLCIVKDKLVWALYCDITVLDHDGCILDAAVIALTTALKTVKLPMVDYNIDTQLYKVNEDIKMPLTINNRIPIATSFMLFGDENILIMDPTADEETLSAAIITIAICDSEIVYIYNPGGIPLPPEKLNSCLTLAINREETLQKFIINILK